MPRSRFEIALAATTFTVIVTVHLISSYGFPTLDFFDFYQGQRWESGNYQHVFPGQTDWSGSNVEGDRYILGVGKADITGYGSSA
jgi:hypothetical protein